MVQAPSRLFTWIDIENHLERLARNSEWPAWLLATNSYWDAAELTVDETIDAQEIVRWLNEVFGQRTVEQDGSDYYFRLDGSRRGTQWSSRSLPLRVERAAHIDTADLAPRWRATQISPSIQRKVLVADLNNLPGPPVVAFHSYKGGVGRTLHAVAAARVLAKNHTKVLLIDGDLEAPGISWMYAAGGRKVDFAYDDFLSLVHSSSERNHADAVSIAATHLANQELDNVVLMPSRRNLDDIEPAAVDPSDLTRASENPFLTAEVISALAAELGADVAIVDLRAGASELSSSLLLDPRVFRVYVSTISSQSVDGSAKVIRSVGDRIEQKPGLNSAILLTQYRVSGQERLVADAAVTLKDALSGSALSNQEEVTDADLLSEPLFSAFNENLLGLPRDWDDVLAVIASEDVERQMLPILDLALAEDEEASEGHSQSASTGSTESSTRLERERLLDFSSNLAFAETASNTDFLPTDSLERLVAAHRTELPLSVVVGAKGAGKTFTYLQMAYRERWSSYSEAVGVQGVSNDGLFVPVFASEHLNAEAADRIDAIRRSAAANTSGAEPFRSYLELKDVVTAALSQGEDVSLAEWRRIWLWCCARAAGIDTTIEGVEDALAHLDDETPCVFLIDGLEDVLLDIVTSEHQQRALRVLLTDCIEWLRSLRKSSLGIVIFARRDLVQAALPQNIGQFFSRYREFELKWNPSEALRLVAWVVGSSTTTLASTPDDIVSATSENLTNMLLPVWGDKMGSEKSREARSDNWFIAALSDFNSQIQARDIVIFLKESAEASLDDSRWSDRLLTPNGMRNALSGASREKIRAISEESPAVGAILSRLSGLPDDQRQIPFTQTELGLSRTDVELLSSTGVIFIEEDQCWIPEIYRHGLRFRASGRPRILAIANLVRKRNPLD